MKLEWVKHRDINNECGAYAGSDPRNHGLIRAVLKENPIDYLWVLTFPNSGISGVFEFLTKEGAMQFAEYRLGE